jgi:hypothetical protein
MKRIFALSAMLYSGHAAEEDSPPVCRLGEGFEDGMPCVADGDMLLQTKKAKKHLPGEAGDAPPDAEGDQEQPYNGPMVSC